MYHRWWSTVPVIKLQCQQWCPGITTHADVLEAEDDFGKFLKPAERIKIHGIQVSSINGYCMSEGKQISTKVFLHIFLDIKIGCHLTRPNNDICVFQVFSLEKVRYGQSELIFNFTAFFYR